jgi:CHAT domain-containing protein
VPRAKTNSWIGLGLLSLGAVLCAGSLPSILPEAASHELELLPEKPVRHGLLEGESHEYRLLLASGDVVDVTVEQNGIDVSLILSGPDGEALLSMDTPKGTRGAERLFDLAETGGIYRLRVQAATGRGSYVLRLAKPRPAGPTDRLRARAWQEYDRGENLRRMRTGKDQRQALVHYGKASRLWQTLGNRDQQAIALYRRAQLLRGLGDVPGAVDSFERALPLLTHPGLRLSVLNILTTSHVDLGNMPRAIEAGQQALELAPQTGDLALHAGALNNMGLIYRRLGESGKALKYFEDSLDRGQALGPSSQRAKTLANRAEILIALGNSRSAIKPLMEALRMQEELEDTKSQPLIYRDLGVAFDRLGIHLTAMGFLDMARESAQANEDRWVEGLALNDKAWALLSTDRDAEAWEAFTEAGRIAREGGNKDNEAFAFAGLGNVSMKRGDLAEALEHFARSEELYTELGDPNALSTVLYRQALAKRRLGQTEDSLASIERALKLVESLREDVDQSDLQIHVIGARSDFYDLKVDLLLRLHEQRPGQGLDAQAFAASEWRRARSLLDMVKKMGGGLPRPRDLSQESLRLQEDLRLNLQQLAVEKLRIVSGASERGRRGLPEVEDKIQEALAQWENLSAEMRRQSPVYATVTAPKLVGVREVQQLLDADTALVAYTVGEERSILWWIERNVLEVHQELPSRAKLEALANDAYDLLSKRRQTKQRGLSESVLDQLGKSLLEPVVHRLGGVRRIAVVADETLQALPFAVLPVPGSGEPLVESHAVVQLPSASLVAALRARQQSRATPPEVIAVFDHPVFGSSDPRFQQGRGKPGSPGSLRPPGELFPLPESSREAEAILKLVPAARSRRFTGFAANRQAAMDPSLRRYRYIHFATHGLVDPDTPNLSGILLSRIDPQGRSLEAGGLLPFYEVYNLSFPADLVTLSACRTVDGPRVRGEGPLGMSRSFLYAGASRVMGTLWNVDDKDAADLMTLFYQFLLRDGKSPAVALQEAQKAMRTRPRTSDPYHWAGFVLQGDWR